MGAWLMGIAIDPGAHTDRHIDPYVPGFEQWLRIPGGRWHVEGWLAPEGMQMGVLYFATLGSPAPEGAPRS